MFSLKGVLYMDKHDLEHIQGRIDEDKDSPMDALKKELELCGLDIKDIFEIELNMGQLKEKRYIDIYSKIACLGINNVRKDVKLDFNTEYGENANETLNDMGDVENESER